MADIAEAPNPHAVTSIEAAQLVLTRHPDVQAITIFALIDGGLHVHHVGQVTIVRDGTGVAQTSWVRRLLSVVLDMAERFGALDEPPPKKIALPH